MSGANDPYDPKQVAALSAEAHLASQAAQDKQDAPLIDKGRKLLASNECARCHRFYDAGKAGAAPDLTGYGSVSYTHLTLPTNYPV